MNNYLLTIRISLNNKLDDIVARQETEQIVKELQLDKFNPSVKLQRLVEGQVPIGVKLSGRGGMEDSQG